MLLPIHTYMYVFFYGCLSLLIYSFHLLFCQWSMKYETHFETISSFIKKKKNEIQIQPRFPGPKVNLSPSVPSLTLFLICFLPRNGDANTKILLNTPNYPPFLLVDTSKGQVPICLACPGRWQRRPCYSLYLYGTMIAFSLFHLYANLLQDLSTLLSQASFYPAGLANSLIEIYSVLNGVWCCVLARQMLAVMAVDCRRRF